jgi:hypothetical protein
MKNKEEEMQVEDIYCYEDSDKERIQLSTGDSYGNDLMLSGIVNNTCHVSCLIPKEEAMKMALAILHNYGYTSIEKTFDVSGEVVKEEEK